MPTGSEILEKRRIVNPLGQKFGISEVDFGKHGQESQEVAKIIAMTRNGRAVLDIFTTFALRTGIGKEKTLVQIKKARKVVNLNETSFR